MRPDRYRELNEVSVMKAQDSQQGFAGAQPPDTSDGQAQPLPPAAGSDIADALLGFASCFGARDRSEVYLSAPITTGRAFVAWQRLVGSQLSPDHPHYESLHHKNVVELNLRQVPPLLAKIRSRFPGRLVIDPTSLDDVPGWEQEDYHRFWCSLIERYISVVVFADGWHFSTGCIYEFATALRSADQILDETFAPLSRAEGTRLIRQAIAEIEQLSLDSTLLRRGLDEIESSSGS
ncbi:MAG TPA: hypothetical protein VNF47_09360 [Streptosporangiaceae bacterium]|nr:hypothetical protein [Streptosporangiaceae bacterium]